MNISESSLLRSLNAVSRYSARDMADLCMLYLITLHILRCEFDSAPFARDYAKSTISFRNWDHVRIHNTDLYQLLNILISQNPAWTNNLQKPTASKLLLQDIHVDTHVVQQLLQNIAKGGFDPNLSGRLLLKIERDLHIQVSNYRSMRRIASDWTQSHVTQEAKSLVVTRLLQALRHKAFAGDLLPQLKKLANRENLEIKQACDPETGANCVEPTKQSSPSLLKQIAVGAGLGVGAYLLGKALFGGSK